jgi:hypothetical protein
MAQLCSSRDPIGFVDGNNLYRLNQSLQRLDPQGTHVILSPKSLPKDQPWTDDPSMPELAVTTPLFDPQFKCVRCGKCKGYRVGHFKINLSFNVKINVNRSRGEPAPNPTPPGWSEPEWTYGHEQRHIANAIAEANNIMKALDAKSRVCFEFEVECRIEGLTMALDATNTFSAFWSDEQKHRHAPFNVGGGATAGFPPIGTMPNVTP